MKRLISGLYQSYRLYHEANPSLLQWIGVVGFTALSALYLVRLTGKLPPRWDDVYFRVPGIVLCLCLAGRRWWPPAAARYYLAYSYVTVFYCLAFFLPLTLLQNRAAANTVVNMVIGAVLIILLTDWRNTIAMILGGYAASLGCYWLINPNPALPLEFLYWWLPLCLVLGAGGSISKYVEKRGELERLRRLYSGLAGSIAHEVRNPLSQAQHALDTISAVLPAASRDGTATLTSQQLADISRTLARGRQATSRGLQAITLTLQQLNDRTLDTSRFTTLSAVQCVQRAVDGYAYEEASQRQHVHVHSEGDFRFRADPAAMELVLFNLLRNALYYLPLHPDMAVSLTVRAVPSPRIVVRDTGPGIAPELMPRLFQEFQTAGKAEGTGLGLAFCRRVMRSLGGDIRCESEPGRFTEFTLLFPAALPEDTAQPDSGTSLAPARPLAGRTILVVDDQAINRAIARVQATELGLRVVEAAHGAQALDMLRGGWVPDAILMDVNMPGQNGIETTRLLRQMPGAAGRVPVVAVTANDSAQVQQAARAAGMHGVLGKPIDPGLLAHALSQAIDSAGIGALPQPTEPPGGLLNTARIDDFRRLGLLDDLLPGALAEMHRQVGRIEACLSADDRQGIQQALHDFVGLSGEAGAQALHGLARRRYAELLHSADSAGTAWLAELRDLLAATERAMVQQYRVQFPAQAAGRVGPSHPLEA